MTDMYTAFQDLFDTLRDKVGFSPTAPAPADQIQALSALKNQLGQIADALERAVVDLQNQGQTNHALTRALQIANHCHAGAAQLLVRAIDGSEAIRASTRAMEERTGELGSISKNTADLIGDLKTVTAVISAAGKTLEFIRS